jgi:hypothetical protein
MNPLLLALVLNCADGKDCHYDHDKKADAAKVETSTIVRGEKLQNLKNIELASILKTPTDFDGKSVHVEGTVRKACEKKGCWMELASAEKDGPAVRVTFKDYAFFVPLDSAGSKVKVEGSVKVAELSKEKAEHFIAEGAKVAKGKDGKYRDVQLVAVAVELTK